MFYGGIIKASSPLKLSDDKKGNFLHLSQLCLNNPKLEGKTYVNVTKGNTSYVAGILEKDKTEQLTIDLFFSATSGFQLKTTGAANEVHVVGYYEPDEADLSNDEEVMTNSRKRPASLQSESRKGKSKKVTEVDSDDEDAPEELKQLLGMKNALKNGGNVGDDDEEDEDDDEDVGEEEEIDSDEVGDDEDDDDDDDDDDDEDDDDDDDAMNGKKELNGIDDEAEEDDAADDDDDDEDEDDEDEDDEEDDDDDDDEDEDDEEEDIQKEEKKNEANKATEMKKKNAKTDVQQNEGKKAAKGAMKNGSPDKSAKAGGSASGGAIDKFEASLVSYLKAHGRTNIALLGSKVKKPAELTAKLGAFMKTRPAVFKIENSSVSLVA